MKIEFRESEYQEDLSSSYPSLSEWEMEVRIVTDDGPVEAFDDGYFYASMGLFLGHCLSALSDVMVEIELRTLPNLDAMWELVFELVGRRVGMFADFDGLRESRVEVSRSEFAKGLLDGVKAFLEYIERAYPEWTETAEYRKLEVKLAENQQWYESIFARNEVL